MPVFRVRHSLSTGQNLDGPPLLGWIAGRGASGGNRNREKRRMNLRLVRRKHWMLVGSRTFMISRGNSSGSAKSPNAILMEGLHVKTAAECWFAESVCGRRKWNQSCWGGFSSSAFVRLINFRFGLPGRKFSKTSRLS